MGKGSGKGASGGGDAPDLGIPYLQQSLGVVVTARAGWLSVFFAGLLLTMIIMQSFEEVLEANVQLSFFVPLIVGHAGNTGSQAVSTIIRALALAEATLADSLHITKKEFMAGGMIGLYLAAFAYPLGVWVAAIPWRVMFSVAVSLPSVSCVANLIGAGLPLICEKFKLDPAVIAAPMMTTMVDCSGILTYLMISQVIIGEQHTEKELEEMEGRIEGELERNFHVAPCPGAETPVADVVDTHGNQVHGTDAVAGVDGMQTNHTSTDHVSAAEAPVADEGSAIINIGMTVLLVVMILVSLKIAWSAKKQQHKGCASAAEAATAPTKQSVTLSIRTITGTTNTISVDRPLTPTALKAAVSLAFDGLPSGEQQFALASDPDALLPADPLVDLESLGLVREGTELLLILTELGPAPIERMLPKSAIETAMREVIQCLTPNGDVASPRASAASFSPTPDPGAGTPTVGGRRRRRSIFNLNGSAESPERGGDNGGNSNTPSEEMPHGAALSPTVSGATPATSGRRRRLSIFNLKGSDSGSAALPVLDVDLDAGKIVKQLAAKLGVDVILKTEAHKHMRYLKKVPLLKHLSAVELRSLVMSLEVCRFSAGEAVITEGDNDKDMFIVESGTAVCTKEGVNNGLPIMHYGAGDFFGERGLLANEPRAATITAESAAGDSDLCVMRLDRSAYELILQSGNDVQGKINSLQQRYYRTAAAGNRIGRTGGLGDVGGPTVADAMKSIFKRRKSIEVLSPEPVGHQAGVRMPAAGVARSHASMRHSFSSVSSAGLEGDATNTADSFSAASTGPNSTSFTTLAVDNPVAHSRYDIAEPPALTLPPSHAVLSRLQDERQSGLINEESPLPRAAESQAPAPKNNLSVEPPAVGQEHPTMSMRTVAAVVDSEV